MELPSYEDYYLKSIFDTDLEKFQCDSRLESYFKEDAKDTETELIAKTYFLHKQSAANPLVGFSISNNAINANIDLDMGIVHKARYKTYPAVLIGRFATHKDYLGQGYGLLALDLIKNWFITNNKTGCRFIVVDSRKDALDFYAKAGFEEYPEESPNVNNKFLYFDLKAYQEQMRRLFH
ncbi:GNAT family N-acetyltransferase [Leptospira sp. WS58.C1]|uniref:GNAT family N-acetyltransferase n=1 Tax=Leptospira cinconiae TaxID=3235173 RepID=UPI00349ECBCC